MSYPKKIEEPVKNYDGVMQENPHACKQLIDQVFAEILQEEILEIYYNGCDLMVQTEREKRHLWQKKITQNFYEMLKKIANYMNRPFSIQFPILDVTFYEYHLLATHPEITRKNSQKVVTFSLQKNSLGLKIKKEDESYAPKEIFYLLQLLINSDQTILISGKTGSGRTELQKYFVSLMRDNDRIIRIEKEKRMQMNESVLKRDITHWLIHSKSANLSSLLQLSQQIDFNYLLFFEIGVKESYDLLQFILRGSPTIANLSCDSAKNNLQRMIKMCSFEDKIDEKNNLQSLATAARIGIHVEKTYDELQKKYQYRINEVCEYIPTTIGYRINMLYEFLPNGMKHFGTISPSLMKEIRKYNPIKDVPIFYQMRKRKNEME